MSNDSRTRWLAINYAATIFLSAFLLFQVQPLVSKFILPWFGGSPAVWTSCMLFFQTLLFGGYAYAHFVSQRLNPKQQAGLHLAVILTALVLLLATPGGVVPGESWKPNDVADPIGRILLLLAASVGLPYFVLSTTGPLIQAWFARSYPGRTPYRLYALSNVGSLLALLSYPVVFERLFAVRLQAMYWTWGFAAFAILCGAAAVWLWKAESGANADGRRQKAEGPAVEGLVVDANSDPSRPGAPGSEADAAIAPPLFWHRALWLLLPAAASITLLATTNHVCTDVAVMPFLWVAPLALYLCTFIVAFDHPRWYRPGLIAAITMIAIYGAALGIGTTDLFQSGYTGGIIRWFSDRLTGSHGTAEKSLEISIDLLPYLAIDFTAMFGTCLLCHGELVRLRPAPKYLTSFYLMISAGGALGGLLVTLVAPHIFKTYFEWELASYFGFALALGLLLRSIIRSGRQPSPQRAIILAIPILLLGALALADMTDYLKYPTEGVLLRTRNFFGTLSVREFDAKNADRRIILKHGAITHGMEYLAEDRRCETATYYTPFSGIGRAVHFLKQQPQAPALEIDAKTGDAVAHSKANDAMVNEAVTAEHAHAKAIKESESKEKDGKDPQVASTGTDGSKRLRIGAVGLGTGTLAAYVDPGDSISFYEINPQVEEIAASGKWFTFLSDCNARGGQCDVKLGDARLVMEREARDGKPQQFDLLVLDAFSGDAIPAHLLTKEAFEIYMQHMAGAEAGRCDGAFAIHITNHYVDLEPLVRGLAEQYKLQGVKIECPGVGGHGIFHSVWVILTRNPDLLAALKPFDSGLGKADADHPAKPAILWTDGQNNLFDVLK